MKILLIAFLILIVIIIIATIFTKSPDEIIKEKLAERDRLDEIEKKRKEAERCEIANKLNNSEIFKALEAKIFTSDKNRPQKIYWDQIKSSGSNICVEYKNSGSIYIPAEEIPDCLEFMRALGYKYRNEYTYTEYDQIDGCSGYYITLYKIPSPVQKPSW